ncbi:MAG: hypothetical protein ACXQTR_03815 [Candidatus Methanospirareceae archaeon]
MNLEEAKARVQALLNVIETSYAIKIVNIEEVAGAITDKTHNEQKILTICTALNTWVALNAGLSGEVEIPLNFVNSIL